MTIIHYECDGFVMILRKFDKNFKKVAKKSKKFKKILQF
jgi:hypothetical protein